MLKVNFIKKFSIKTLSTSHFRSLESQSHLLEAEGCLAPGQGSLHEAWRPARAHSREESCGQRWAQVSNAGEAAVAAAVAEPALRTAVSAAQSVPRWLSLAEANTTGEEKVNQGCTQWRRREETGRQNRRPSRPPSTLRGLRHLLGRHEGRRQETHRLVHWVSALKELPPLSGGAPESRSAVLPPRNHGPLPARAPGLHSLRAAFPAADRP